MDFSHLDWTATLGDRSVMGWLTVVAYFGAAWLCLRAAGYAPARIAGGPAPTERRFWQICAAAMFLMGINKQLDLQILVQEVARILVRDEGWFQRRREFQKEFVALLLLLAMAAGAIGYRMVRHCRREVHFALLGLVLTAAFVLVRASSIHHVDALINARVGGMRWNWLLELPGIAVVAAAALEYMRGGRWVR